MILARLSWNLRTVFFLHILRLVFGIFLVRGIYPLLFTATPFIVEVTDRLIVILLVWLGMGRCRGELDRLGLSLHDLASKVFKGVAVGLILLGVSVFSERIVTSILLATPSPHPLVVQVENASSWQELLVPLFLAGILAPISEELLYRLFTFLPMKERFGLWSGAFASSLVFALMHFNLYWLGEMVFVGMGLAFLYNWTGSLVSGMIAHGVINTGKIVMLFLNVTWF